MPTWKEEEDSSVHPNDSQYPMVWNNEETGRQLQLRTGRVGFIDPNELLAALVVKLVAKHSNTPLSDGSLGSLHSECTNIVTNVFGSEYNKLFVNKREFTKSKCQNVSSILVEIYGNDIPTVQKVWSHPSFMVTSKMILMRQDFLNGR